MKKTLLTLVLLTLAVTLTLGLISCGGAEHTHAYTEENTDSKYLASSANCGSAAKYYYSCSCGEKGTETFTSGKALTVHQTENGKCKVCGLSESSVGLKFELNDDQKSYTVVGIGACTDTDIVIGSYNNMSVTSIGYSAFLDCTSLTSVTISNSVTSIGVYAFKSCYNLTSVTIPDSVTTIGEWAFSHCASLTSVTIPDSVTLIGIAAFENCASLTSVTIGNSVTSIRSSTFSGCRRLTSVTIGNSVTSIDSSAFSGCVSLISIEANENNQYYKDIDGNLYSKDGKTLIAYAIGKTDTSFTIPNSVTSIGSSAFSGCDSLTSVTIPDSVTSIGYAFSYCYSLTSVTIGNSVTSIGSDAFLGCYKLVEVINKSSLTITAGLSDYGGIGYYAIEVHSGESKIKNVNDYLFYTYNGVNYLLGYVGGDTSLTLPESYNGQNYEIYNYAFYNCDDIVSVTIPDSVTSIGSSAFSGCDSLTSVTIPDSVTSIGYEAFYNCYKLVEVSGESKIKNVNDYLFYTYNGVNYLVGYVGGDTSLTLPENYNGQNYEIYNYAFYNCDDIVSVTIPNSVTSIGSFAFWGCASLESVTFENPNGWQRSSSYGATTSNTAISSSALQNTATAATCLTTYYNCYWKRS